MEEKELCSYSNFSQCSLRPQEAVTFNSAVCAFSLSEYLSFQERSAQDELVTVGAPLGITPKGASMPAK